MIFILSEQYDKTTDQVIDWIEYLSDVKICRINTDDFLSATDIVISDNLVNFQITMGNMSIKYSDIGAYWYRRGMFNRLLPQINKDETGAKWAQKFTAHLQEEDTYLFKFIHNKLNKKYHINTFEDNFLNKLIALDTAKAIGLKIPTTVITTNPRPLKNIFSGKPIITKSISQQVGYEHDDCMYVAATEAVNYEETTSQDAYSLPSLFQNEVTKVFELRIFVVHDTIFSMAIFSQNDEQTRLDYRNYNFRKMNRMVPFLLPEEMAEKIKQLMHHLNLNSGSVDMIYETNGDYVFLEVNPIGQFGMVSSPCNYYIEKFIAQQLIDHHSC